MKAEVLNQVGQDVVDALEAKKLLDTIVVRIDGITALLAEELGVTADEAFFRVEQLNRLTREIEENRLAALNDAVVMARLKTISKEIGLIINSTTALFRLCADMYSAMQKLVDHDYSKENLDFAKRVVERIKLKDYVSAKSRANRKKGSEKGRAEKNKERLVVKSFLEKRPDLVDKPKSFKSRAIIIAYNNGDFTAPTDGLDKRFKERDGDSLSRFEYLERLIP
ncbi:hypothetical protein ABHF33_03935 [Chitinibacter sp. FCG-7]|uniref:Uncharacterized protein n=1 Tax=Chitinibacter mangrovi TaxID=3153927 RepID=A0AAU7F9R7_9NEIS